MFELLLIKSPKNLIDLAEIIHMLTTQNYNSPMITFINAKEFNILAKETTDWSLDGEYQKGCNEIHIRNLHHAIDVIMNRK
jgi:diacylglycerol kinase family enzyme